MSTTPKLRLDELLQNLVLAREGLVVRQPVGAGDRQGIDPRGRVHAPPLRAGGDRQRAGREGQQGARNLGLGHVLGGDLVEARGAHHVVQRGPRGCAGAERVESHGAGVGRGGAGHDLPAH